ncbi:cytochrome c oxidase subunit 6A1, mitochondrial-like [Dreissena polymorpha]|uniref:Uncharacterized protein n=1 Tax=Dreissena polymorpha TaxID=45954 RepID=A0A9D4MWM7_DREPO|nr:cytochrome c oxidase subunit 6A1, mitochondrial-like [Dreissena polymorpha]KAH3885243.1 hypothetical protein DPMN_009236 [Dreissena polymorpha]
MSGVLGKGILANIRRLSAKQTQNAARTNISTSKSLQVVQPYTEYHEFHLRECKMYTYMIWGLVAPGLALYKWYIMTHHVEREPLPDFPHLHIMTKPYPWGDGKTCLFNYKIQKFHNPEDYGHLRTRKEEEDED